MAGTSNFPRALDTDTNLLRRIATDAMVVADHNNLVDALESVEPTVGVCDDGTAYGSQAFNRGLADHTGFMTTAGPNGRFPYSPRLTGSWYGTDNALGVGWVLDAGLATSFSPPKGPVLISHPDDVVARKLVVPLPGASPFYAFVRCRYALPATDGIFWAGFSALGTVADLSGVTFDPSGDYNAVVAGAQVGALVSTLQLPGAPCGWLTWYLSLVAGVFTARVSADGMTYDTIYSGASALAATKLVIQLQGNGTLLGQAGRLWLDFVSFGNAAPAGL